MRKFSNGKVWSNKRYAQLLLYISQDLCKSHVKNDGGVVPIRLKTTILETELHAGIATHSDDYAHVRYQEQTYLAVLDEFARLSVEAAYGIDNIIEVPPIIDKWVLPVIDEAIAAHFVDKEDVE